MIFCKTGELIIRSLEHADKKFLVKWLSDSKVLEHYEGRDNIYDENMVEKKFYTSSKKTRCIIEYLDEPIGYIQFYRIGEEQYEEYGYTDIHSIIYGIDQFIGETKYWEQGIGTMLMKEIVRFLVTEMDVQKIVLDPQSRNKRAIACYEKSGFKKIKILPNHELHEGNLQDCWLMEYNNL